MRSKDRSFVTRPAITNRQPRQLFRFFSFGGGLSLLPFISWIFPLRTNSVRILMRERLPTGNTSGRRAAISRLVPDLVDGRVVLKLRRREDMASRSVITCACCCGRLDPGGGVLHIQLLRPVSSAWPVALGRVRVNHSIFSSFQGSNFIRRSGSAGARLGWPDAEKRGAHSVR